VEQRLFLGEHRYRCFFLGVSEVISHRYSLRVESQVSDEQTETKRQHEEELARLHLETAKANEEAARLTIAVRPRNPEACAAPFNG